MEKTNEVADVRAGLMGRLGISLEQSSARVTVGSMPVRGNTQIFGVLHGGATAALAETVASVAATEHARQLSKDSRALVAVGTEITVSHLRSASEGHVTATATAEHLGRTRTVHRVDVVRGDGKSIATGLVTNLLVEPRA